MDSIVEVSLHSQSGWCFEIVCEWFECYAMWFVSNGAALRLFRHCFVNSPTHVQQRKNEEKNHPVHQEAKETAGKIPWKYQEQ